MAASTSSTPLQQALTQIIQRASVATATHVDPAVERLTESQNGLEAELQRLDDEMTSVTSVLETVTLDPETSARMQETQECLKRTKKKLITIRGRLGRLRAYEESDRLQLTERSLDVLQEGTAGTSGEEGGDTVEGTEVGLDNHDDGRRKGAVESDMISIEQMEDREESAAQGAQIIPPESSEENEENSPPINGLT